TAWWTCGFVARGIAVGWSARAGRERQSPSRTQANEDVRVMNRSPCKKNDRRQIVFSSATAGFSTRTRIPPTMRCMNTSCQLSKGYDGGQTEALRYPYPNERALQEAILR